MLNKVDLTTGRGCRFCEAQTEFVELSALTGEGIEELERALTGELFDDDRPSDAEGESAVNERHAGLLEEGRRALNEAASNWDAGGESELLMIDLREALASIDEVLGLAPGEAILDRVFERFCIGK